jgi:hypothetical protein
VSSLTGTALFCCMLSPALIAAQDLRQHVPTFAVGKRVRVSAPALVAKPVVGVLASADSQALSVAMTRNGTAVIVPMTAVTELSVSEGRDRAKGATRGLIAGLAGGALMILSSQEELRDLGGDGLTGGIPLGLAVFIFTAVPVAAGTLIGIAIAPEGWETSRFARANGEPGKLALKFAATDELRIAFTGGRFQGRVTARDDSLDVYTREGRRTVAWNDVRGIQGWGGRKRWKGAAIGALAFIGLGIWGEQTAPTTSTGERIGAFTGATVVGAYLGSRLITPKGWISLPLPSR